MFSGVRKLTAVQLYNVCGINEFRHTKDPKRKRRWIGMAVLWAFLSLMMLGYLIAFTVGMISLGVGEIIPAYLFTASSLIILFFTLLKAGSVLFQQQTYEMLVTLPVSKAAVVISRFLTMYVSDLALSALVVLPCSVIYGVWAGMGPWYYFSCAIGVLFAPMLPITLATALGAAVTALSARMRHKSVISAAITMAVAVAIILASSLSGGGRSISSDMIQNLAESIGVQLQRTYPPAGWFQNSAMGGKPLYLLLLVGVSAAALCLLVLVLQRSFGAICAALNATGAKSNYHMQQLKASSPLRALFQRELKRYFASSIYVANTMMGYLLMAVTSVAVLIVGKVRIEAMLPIPNMVETVLPFVLGALATIAPTTVCAISMEGKQFWIAQTLPVRSRDVFNSKILVNLAVAAPGYLVAVVCSLLAVRPGPMGILWMILTPAVYILFSAVTGLTANLAMPILDWESETRAVKQGMAALIEMLVALVSVGVPLVALIGLRVSVNLITPATCVVLLAVSGLLHRKNNRIALQEIGR